MSPKKRKEISEPQTNGEIWEFRLYVMGATEKSIRAFQNLKKICDEHVSDRCRIEVIDLSRHPEMAQRDQIIALPTLVKSLPPPVRRVIGDLSNTALVLIGVDLKAREHQPGSGR